MTTIFVTQPVDSTGKKAQLTGKKAQLTGKKAQLNRCKPLARAARRVYKQEKTRKNEKTLHRRVIGMNRENGK
ncbi:hypothetical protein, partial [Pseudomonas savastanoi]|uniref:hypothetical protein n=1 Tax=Pseudomonas savastanoi TaxID=29438 RepID=UPI001C7EED82